MPFAPLGSERYGRKNTFAVIEFAKPEAAGFLQSAFTIGQQSAIPDTSVDNSAESTTDFAKATGQVRSN